MLYSRTHMATVGIKGLKHTTDRTYDNRSYSNYPCAKYRAIDHYISAAVTHNCSDELDCDFYAVSGMLCLTTCCYSN